MDRLALPLRLALGLLLGASSACVIQGGRVPSGGVGALQSDCAPGERCACDQVGSCEYECTGPDCNFECSGIGSCEFLCPDGGCDAVCSGSGSCELDCPGGDCSLTCRGSGSCELDCDGQECELDCEIAGNCEER
ncbi:MAG: hypothetical protein AAF721_34525 [Myxococcota bacterium]